MTAHTQILMSGVLYIFAGPRVDQVARMHAQLAATFCLLSLSAGTILQNGQVRETDYPDTQIDLFEGSWRTYGANATEIHYMGRWDAKHVSHWS